MTLEEGLLKLHAVRGVLGKRQAHPSLKVVRPFRSQVAAAKGAAHGVVEVRERRMAHRPVGRSKQDGRPVARHVDGQLCSGHETGAEHGVVVPRSRGRQREDPHLRTVTYRHVGVESEIGTAIHAVAAGVGRQTVHPQEVAFHEFASRIHRHEGLPQVRLQPPRNTPARGLADVLVAAFVPAGARGKQASGVPGHDVEPVVGQGEKVVMLTEQLKHVGVRAVVQRRLQRRVFPNLGVHGLRLEGLGLFVLEGEPRGVKILRPEVLAHEPCACAQRTPISSQPTCVAGTQHGSVGVWGKACGADAAQRHTVACHGLGVQVCAEVHPRLGAHPSVRTRLGHDECTVLGRRTGRQRHRAGHGSSSKCAGRTAAEHFDAGDVFRVDWQVHQVVACLGGAPTHTVHPQRGLLERAATDTQIGADAHRAS